MVSGIVLVFAFVLGLTVSEEATTLKQAREATATEANGVGELYWYAHTLPEPEHSRLQGLLRAYAAQVVADFPLLGQHLPSAATYAALRAVRNDILDFRPGPTITEEEVYKDEMIQISNVFAARRIRIEAATNGGVPTIFIQGLVVLVVLILSLIPLSGLLRGPRELIFYGAFAAFLIATLFLVTDMNNPFAGTVSVRPTPFNILFHETFVYVS
jgi:hypothetical protein